MPPQRRFRLSLDTPEPSSSDSDSSLSSIESDCETIEARHATETPPPPVPRQHSDDTRRAFQVTPPITLFPGLQQHAGNGGCEDTQHNNNNNNDRGHNNNSSSDSSDMTDNMSSPTEEQGKESDGESEKVREAR